MTVEEQEGVESVWSKEPGMRICLVGIKNTMPADMAIRFQITDPILLSSTRNYCKVYYLSCEQYSADNLDSSSFDPHMPELEQTVCKENARCQNCVGAFLNVSNMAA